MFSVLMRVTGFGYKLSFCIAVAYLFGPSLHLRFGNLTRRVPSQDELPDEAEHLCLRVGSRNA